MDGAIITAPVGACQTPAFAKINPMIGASLIRRRQTIPNLIIPMGGLRALVDQMSIPERADNKIAGYSRALADLDLFTKIWWFGRRDEWSASC